MAVTAPDGARRPRRPEDTVRADGRFSRLPRDLPTSPGPSTVGRCVQLARENGGLACSGERGLS